MNFIQLTAISAFLFVASAAIAAPAPSAGERSLSDTSATTLLAREAESGDDRGDDGEEFEIDDHA